MTVTLVERRDSKFLDEFTLLLQQEDEPMGYEAGDANLYRYVGNSPTNFLDPNGLEYPPPGAAPRPFPHGQRPHWSGGGHGGAFPQGYPRRPSPPPPDRMSIPDLECYLKSKGSTNIPSIIGALTNTQNEIANGGGIVTFIFFWETPKKDGFRCEEADAAVEDHMRPIRKQGWNYEHEERDGWILDHNWGHVEGPGDVSFYVDFWSNFAYPITLTPPR